MTWRRVALALPGSSSPAYLADAAAHFIIGYVLGRAIMTRPMTATTAMR